MVLSMAGVAQREPCKVLPMKLSLKTATPAGFVQFVVSVASTSPLVTEAISWLGLEANKANSTFSYLGKKCGEGVLYKTPFATIHVLLLKLVLEREV